MAASQRGPLYSPRELAGGSIKLPPHPDEVAVSLFNLMYLVGSGQISVEEAVRVLADKEQSQ